MKRTPRATSSAGPENGSAGKINSDVTDNHKPGEFRLEAPHAKSVKLAGDFTEWEKNPIDLTRSEHGVWRLILPLPRGEHPYRFVVDGQWCDDPQATRRAANALGTENAIMMVT